MREAILIWKPVSINPADITAARRIYVLSFNRCSTSIHWDRNQLMQAIHSDLNRHGRINLPNHYPRSNAFLNLIQVGKQDEARDHILRQGTLLHRTPINSDPDAYFILNNRNVEDWLTFPCRHATSTAVS